MDNENFSWSKFFNLSPVAFAKVLSISLKVGIIALIILGIFWVKNIMFPRNSLEQHIKQVDKIIINPTRSGFLTGLFGGAHNSGNEWFAGVQLSKEW